MERMVANIYRSQILSLRLPVLPEYLSLPLLLAGEQTRWYVAVEVVVVVHPVV